MRALDYILILGLSLITWSSAVHGQLLESFLIGHFSCAQNMSMMSTNDSFYNSSLFQTYTTTKDAMQFFRSIFRNLSSCTPSTPSSYCACMRMTAGRLGPIGWAFENDERLDDLVKLLSDFRTAYPNQLTPAVIWPDPRSDTYNPFLTPYPSLVAFVLKFDFTFAIVNYYAKTREALANVSRPDVMNRCFQPYLSTNLSLVQNISGDMFKDDALVKYTRCLAQSIAPYMDPPLRRLMGYVFLMVYPSVIKGDFLDFVDALYTAALDNPRKSVWVLGDPHIHSLNKGYQICNFKSRQLCLQTSFFAIYCTAVTFKAGENATVMSDVELIFTSGGGSMMAFYTAGNETFPEKILLITSLVNISSSTIPDVTKLNIWLQLSMPSANKRTILDFQSNTTFTITRSTITGRSIYGIIIRSRIKTLSNSDGLLVKGCDKADLDPTWSPMPSRRRRATDPCANVDTTDTTTDETMPPSVVKSICTHDVTTSGDPSFAAITSDLVSSMRSTASADAVFPTSRALKLLSSSILDLVAVISVFTVIFNRF